jgi:hypothetical protein
MEGGALGLFIVVALTVVMKLLFVVLPVAGVLWFATRTPTGRNLLGLAKKSGEEPLTLEVADQLRNIQAQLDDAHCRLDFAERVMLEQRDQLRALGAPEPHAELREPTPV